MIYGQFRTLINLLLVLALGAVFLWGGFRVFGAFTNSASAPPPTATPRPVIQQLPTIPPPTPTRRTGTGTSTGAKATATPRPTPRPSPTPNTPPKMFVTTSEASSTGAASFKVGTIPLSGGYPQLWCKVRNSALPPGTPSFTMTWTKDGPDISAYQYSVQRLAGEFTYGNYISSRLSVPGAYRCDVNINGQPFGSARFTIAP